MINNQGQTVHKLIGMCKSHLCVASFSLEKFPKSAVPLFCGLCNGTIDFIRVQHGTAYLNSDENGMRYWDDHQGDIDVHHLPDELRCSTCGMLLYSYQLEGAAS